jgi:HSP20 family protein
MEGGGGESGQGGRFLAPQLDVHEGESEYCITVDLPGVAESDLDVSLEGDVLTIRGEKKQQSERDERGYHVMERSSGTFQRSLRLPFEPDPERVHADCRDGVLTVHVPKAGQQQRTRKISVNRGQGMQDGGGGAGRQTLEGRSSTAGSSGGDRNRGANDRDETPRQQAASQQPSAQAGGFDDASGGSAQQHQQQESGKGRAGSGAGQGAPDQQRRRSGDGV